MINLNACAMILFSALIAMVVSLAACPNMTINDENCSDNMISFDPPPSPPDGPNPPPPPPDRNTK